VARERTIGAMTILALALTSAASAQGAGDTLTAEDKDIGKVQVRIEKYEHALGVVSQLNRSPEGYTNCDGICYFPNATAPISWRCGPQRTCSLICTRNPPAGGCR
jgi:hypothetical protein